jgi:hypothetical protein
MTTVPADVALPLVSNARFVDEDEAFWRFVALRVDMGSYSAGAITNSPASTSDIMFL